MILQDQRLAYKVGLQGRLGDENVSDWLVSAASRCGTPPVNFHLFWGNMLVDKIALVIDDNKQNRDLLQMMLKTNGITPLALESPRALDGVLAQHSQVAVMFLDLEFPNYNGFDLIRQFKADPRLQNTPIIAYSVHTSEIEEARAAGFDGFLGKPLKSHQFANQLQSILSGESVWD